MEKLITVITRYETLFFLYTVSGLSAVMVAAGILISAVFRLRRRSQQKTDQVDEQVIPKEISPVPAFLVAMTLAVIIIIVSVTSLFRLLGMNPEISSYPLMSSPYRNQPVVFTFSAPVDMRLLITNQSPDIRGTWQKNTYLPWLPFGRTVTFSPAESLLPHSGIMLYLSNVTKPFSREWGGEYLYEAEVSGMPDIAAVSITDGSTIRPSDPFTFSLTDPPVHSEWSVTSSPSAFLSLTKQTETGFLVAFPDGLVQDTGYTFSFIRTPARKRLDTGEPVSYGAPETVKTVTVRTVKSPLIAGISPADSPADITSTITIEFDQPMDKASVENGLTITPEAEGTVSWDENSRIFTLKPDRTLLKDTAYTLILKTSIKSIEGGMPEHDFRHTFRTVGAPMVAHTFPDNRAANVATDGPIEIRFDQPVIGKTAEDAFSLSPAVPGTFTWNGTTMEFRPAGPLAFETTYTLTVSPGVENALGMQSHEPFTASFTTSPYEKSVMVPYYRQQESFTCNIAAVRMLLTFRGIDIPEQTLKEEAGKGGTKGNGDPNAGYVSGYGTYWEAIARMAGTYRPVRIIKDSDLTTLLGEIEKGNPFMIWGQNGWSDPHELSWTNPDGTRIYAINGMHSYVVRGYRGDINNPSHILVNDPWRGVYAMGTAQFLRLYSYFKTALVVD